MITILESTRYQITFREILENFSKPVGGGESHYVARAKLFNYTLRGLVRHVRHDSASTWYHVSRLQLVQG